MCNLILDFLYPQKCIYCDKLLTFTKSLFLCRSCYRSLPWVNKNHCRKCGRSIGKALASPICCKTCHSNEMFFDNGKSILDFNETSKKIITEIKYAGNLQYKGVLEGLIKMGFKKNKFIPGFDYITYVPLHPVRYKERGFNQSKIIAEIIGKYFKRPVISALKCIKKPHDQAALKLMERSDNVKQMFEINSSYQNKPLNKTLIVDDVLTSGNTLNECSRILSINGFNNISIMTFLSVADH